MSDTPVPNVSALTKCAKLCDNIFSDKNIKKVLEQKKCMKGDVNGLVKSYYEKIFELSSEKEFKMLDVNFVNEKIKNTIHGFAHATVYDILYQVITNDSGSLDEISTRRFEILADKDCIWIVTKMGGKLSGSTLNKVLEQYINEHNIKLASNVSKKKVLRELTDEQNKNVTTTETGKALEPIVEGFSCNMYDSTPLLAIIVVLTMLSFYNSVNDNMTSTQNKILIGAIFFSMCIYYFVIETKTVTKPEIRNKILTMTQIDEYAKNKCRIPVLTAEECWTQEHNNCNYEMRPGDNDRYRQCTNNNLHYPNNLKGSCNGRIDLTTNPTDRVSQTCYSDTINKLKFKGME